MLKVLVVLACVAVVVLAIPIPDEDIPRFDEHGNLLHAGALTTTPHLESDRRDAARRAKAQLMTNDDEDTNLPDPTLGQRYDWNDITPGTYIAEMRTQTSVASLGILGALGPAAPLYMYVNATDELWAMDYRGQTQIVKNGVAYVIDKATETRPQKCTLVAGWGHGKQVFGWKGATYTGNNHGSRFTFTGQGTDIGGGRNPVAMAVKVKYGGKRLKPEMFDFGQQVCSGTRVVDVKGGVTFTGEYLKTIDPIAVAIPQICLDIPLDGSVVLGHPAFHLNRFGSCGLNVVPA